jgi:hypothetical protein
MHLSQNKKFEIFQKTKVGFEIEFFSDLKDRNIASFLKDSLNRKVVLGKTKTSIGKDKIGYHTKIKIDEEKFKLEKDFSGGPMMYELVTSPLPYFEAKKVLISALDTIKEIGWVNDNSAIQINISFDDQECQIMYINILKFCLNFYMLEKEIFKDFPVRKNNIYSESITKIMPDISSLTMDPKDLKVSTTKVKLPTNSKYFGVNFQHMMKDNYLEFRYLGGRNYLKKSSKIVDYLEKFVLFSYDQAVNREVTDRDEEMFNRVITAHFERMKFFNDLESFQKRFKNIHLFVDLETDPSYIQLRFESMKPFLYELIINNNLKEGYINLDTDVSKYQIKDATIKKGLNLHNIEFVNCDLEGVYENCDFYNCTIENALMFDCGLHGYSEVKYSKLIDTSSNTVSTFDNCFIRNDKQRIGGIFNKCIIVGSEDLLLYDSVLDNETLFVDREYGSKKKK